MLMKAELRSDAIKEALTVEVPRHLREHHVEGVSIALIRDRKIVLTVAYGLRNSVTCDPLTPHNIFEAYSLTKPLVAYRALNLYQNGVLDLDRPLDDYLNTPCIGNDHRSGRITARTVLSHTSGLPDDETERRITFTPGEQWSYSTQGYSLLQQVIDRITAERFDENMKRHILDPLAMTSSSFVWEDRFESVMAQGHTTHGIPQSDRQIRVADADSLLTTASDYATFAVACAWPEGGESIDQPARLMMRPQATVADNLYWGLGWGIEETDDGPFLWHIGGGIGAPFQNFVCVSASHGIGIVILTNSANGGALFEPLVRQITGRSFSLFTFVRDYFYDGR
jgi:CubicO group peptidase (beta-lactamase class C family)